MRQLHILFNSAKTWHVIVCWFLCFALNLPELSLKLFWTSVENNFRLSSGKFGAKHRNQQTITCQVLAELNIIWSCLIFIKLYIWILTTDPNLALFLSYVSPNVLTKIQIFDFHVLARWSVIFFFQQKKYLHIHGQKLI